MRSHPGVPVNEDPPLRIVLVEPEIPGNTGTIGRLAMATGCALHLVEPLGLPGGWRRRCVVPASTIGHKPRSITTNR